MDLMFLGCGAADYDWSNYGQEGILGSTVSLLNGHILLDCGPTAAVSMERFGVSAENITAIVNTHNHSDHLNPEQVKLVAGNRRPDFYGSPQACELVKDFCTVHPLTFGDEFVIGNSSLSHPAAKPCFMLWIPRGCSQKHANLSEKPILMR